MTNMLGGRDQELEEARWENFEHVFDLAWVCYASHHTVEATHPGRPTSGSDGGTLPRSNCGPVALNRRGSGLRPTPTSARKVEGRRFDPAPAHNGESRNPSGWRLFVVRPSGKQAEHCGGLGETDPGAPRIAYGFLPPTMV